MVLLLTSLRSLQEKHVGIDEYRTSILMGSPLCYGKTNESKTCSSITALCSCYTHWGISTPPNKEVPVLLE
jgi:hypothetical protein